MNISKDFATHLIYMEYNRIISTIIRTTPWNVTHSEMWNICVNLFKISEDQRTYNIFYRMIEELCDVFVIKEVLAMRRTALFKEEMIAKLEHPDRLERLAKLCNLDLLDYIATRDSE